MKGIVSILLIAIAAAICLFFAPWWVASVFALAVAFGFRLKPGMGFLAGLLGIGLVWAGYAGWIDQANQSILSMRIGELFMGISPPAVILVTAIIGGLSGGLAGVTGAFLSGWLRKS